MARLTSSNSTNGKGNASQRKAASASKPQEAREVKGNKEFSFTFEAPAGHVSTGKTLVVYKGRGNGGVDMYIPLALIAKELGYLPEGAEITVSVKAQGKAISDPFVAVPKTSQHLYDKGENHTWEEVYGSDFAGHLRELKNAKPEEEAPRMAAQGIRTGRAGKAESAPEAPKAESLADARLSRLEGMMEKLAKAVLSGKGK